MLKEIKEASYDANDFGCGLMHELAITAAKNGWSLADISDLAKNSNLMKLVLGTVRGTHKVNFIQHLINCDVLPSLKKGYKIVHHQKMGQLLFDSTLFGFNSFEYPIQIGYDILNSLKKNNFLTEQGDMVLNANVLDYLLLPKNQIIIPKFWRKISCNHHLIYFFGTIYKKDDRFYVRCMYWEDDKKKWCSRYDGLQYSDFLADNSSTIVLRKI